MIVDLTKLENSEIKFDLSIKPGEIEFENEFVSTENDVQFNGKLSNPSAWALIEGEIKAGLKIACGRCLDPVDSSVDFDFETAFITPERFTEENETELEVQGLEVSVFEGHKIDLVEVAQEQVMLSIPSQTFCREDCKGLCTECGANKNLKSCKCEENVIDSRWSALSDIKTKKD